jgi:hypothetical protein
LPSNFKVLNLGDPGSDIQYGADDLDKINNILNGIDLGITIDIGTETRFKNTKLALSDSTDNYKININTSAESQNGSLTVPVLNGNQEVVTTNAGQILQNKTINLMTGGNNITGITDTNIDTNASISWTKLNKNLSKIKDIADTSIATTPTTGDVIQWNGSAWVNSQVSGVSGSGEINTASNVGTSGVGVFKQKSLVDLQFKKLNALSSKITITDDTANSKIDFDANFSSVSLSSLSGTISSTQIAAAAVTTAAIADANVTLAKLAASSVDSSKIVDLSIVNGDISNAANIAWSKLNKTGSSLDDIGDVSITSPVTGHVLTYNGTLWVNQVPAAGGGGGGGSTGAGGTNGNLSMVNDAAPKWGLVSGANVWDANGSIGTGLCNGWYISFGGSGGSLGLDVVTDGETRILLSGASTATGGWASITSRYVFPYVTGGNPKFWAKICTLNISNIRWFIGFTSSLNPVTTTGQFLNGITGIGFRYDSSIDSTIKLISNSGLANNSVYDTGLAALNGVFDYISLKCNSGGTSWTYDLDGQVSATVATNIPNTGTVMVFNCISVNTIAATRNLAVYYIYTENNR